MRGLLIVDDEEDVRAILRDSLQDQVDLVFEATDGEMALEKLKTLKVHAIISDLNMPKMNGLELLRAVREKGLQIPFIVLTGFGEKKMAVEALRLGAFDFLDKPWKETEIIDVVARAVQMGLQQEASRQKSSSPSPPEAARDKASARRMQKLIKSLESKGELADELVGEMADKTAGEMADEPAGERATEPKTGKKPIRSK